MMTNQELIEELIGRTKAHLNRAELLKSLDAKTLNHRPGPRQWSILECLEHLNRYGRFYLPEVSQQLNKGKRVETDHPFKSGWLGNYFAKSMLPKPKLNKMKTFRNMDPQGSELDQSVITEFIRQQKQWLDLLQQARYIDLTKTKTGISIASWIRLRIGDTLRFVIYHNERHMVQLSRLLPEPQKVQATTS